MKHWLIPISFGLICGGLYIYAQVPTSPSGACTGSYSGNATQFQGYNISAAAPSVNQFLQYISSVWTPTSTPTLPLGGKFECTHGTNATCGVATLSISGTALVSTTAIGTLATTGAGYAVSLTALTCTSCGALSVGTVINGTSFVINSTNATDTSNVYWEIKYIN